MTISARDFREGKTIFYKIDLYMVGLSWFEKSIRCDEEGDDEEWYCNYRGSGFPVANCNRPVLEECEANNFDELDWSGTYLTKPNDNAGWLDREGRWYGCDSREHDVYARFVLHKTIEQLEREGWCRVYGPPGSRGDYPSEFVCLYRTGLSEEQKNELSHRGYELEPTYNEPTDDLQSSDDF